LNIQPSQFKGDALLKGVFGNNVEFWLFNVTTNFQRCCACWVVDMFLMMSHDQILDKHTIVDMFLMMSHDQILDKHTIVVMFLMM
jgi:hypothetical protein